MAQDEDQNRPTEPKPVEAPRLEDAKPLSFEGSDPDDTLAASVITEPSGEFDGRLPFPIVGIGASAGGVEAYIELFQHIPDNTGMAFVVLSHLSADQPSYLPEIVGRHTSLPIQTIQNGMRPEPEHIYLLPPNARAVLENGAFRLESPPGEGPRGRRIDEFFESLAAQQKNFAIGVVLSGMDSDGTLGLRAIKGEGGISIVQSPESAHFPDMPRSSISADHVDFVLPPAQIAEKLAQLATRWQKTELRHLEQGLAPPNEERYLARILILLRSVSGVDFGLYKPTTVRRRIARRMLMRRKDTLADYAAMLQTDGKERRELQEDILIGVTRFFRDPEVFEALKQSVFPAIVEACSPEQQIRIWVPGCSSGEEVYSIAMCLIEFLAGCATEPPIQIFGTDASELNIQKARAGIYPETVASEVSAERLRRFFNKTERGYQVSKRIRDLCIFARQNLCHDPAFSRLNLISCRNVLIYFGAPLQKQLIRTFHYALRPDGFVLLGNSETLRNFTDYFSLIDRKHKIYARTASTPAGALLDVDPRPSMADPRVESGPGIAAEVWNDLELQRTADRIILARYGPPGVIINEQMQILQSRGHTSPFLELARGTVSLQLNRMVWEGIAAQVTAAVKRAIDQDLPVQVPGLQIHYGEQTREAMLEVLPIHSVTAHAKCYLVLFVPTTAAPAIASAESTEILPPPAEESEKDRLIRRLQNDLSSTRFYLQSLLEERDAQNQELISANEEIQSANEELQSTNEELETTKEELQSSNEELQTVNDELQNRNTVLMQASNDLQNLLNSVNLPVLMLSSELNIRHLNPQTQRFMNVRASDIGRPFGDIRLNLNIESLEPLFTDVLETLSARELEVQDREGHWYLLRVRPYRTTENKIDGLVAVLVDIDQLRRTQQNLRDARDFARSIIESIPLPLVVVDFELRIRSANEAFCRLTGFDDRSLEGRLLPDLGARWGMEEPLQSRLEKLKRDEGSAKSFEFEHDTGEPDSKAFLVRGCMLQPDGERFLLVTFEDLTDCRNAERQLRAEGARLAREVEATTVELNRSREDLRALTGSLFNSREQEQRRLARELHDDISQRLAALNIAGEQALRIIATDPENARQRIEAAVKQIGQLSEDVRTLSHRLHPSIIEDLGLKAALRSLTQEFGEREDMITTFFADDVPETLPLEMATGLYRITQEALRNVAKHAGKTHAKVRLVGSHAGLELQIADSGQGFDMEQKSPGLGLISMNERARLIGATLKIQSALGEGTKVTVTVPNVPTGMEVRA